MDREKVINGLREMSCRATWKDIDRIRHKFQPIINDAIALLKEQEAKKVKVDMYGNFYCPWCSTDTTIEMGIMKLHIGTDYCPYCGNKVRWE